MRPHCCPQVAGTMLASSLMATSVLLAAAAILIRPSEAQFAQPTRARTPTRARVERPVLKDAFYEDNKAIVRIKTTYNASSSITCNGVVMDMANLVLSDVSCIKYQGMANIDARYVQVISGEPGQEEFYEVDQIFINKANPNDPSTELALLKLKRAIQFTSACLNIRPPELNTSLVPESSVRVIGYTQNYELKENRTKISRRVPNGSEKYVCTTPADHSETPGAQLLKGAPLLAPVDCRTFHMVGILTRVDSFFDGNRKQQDCYVMINSQIKWYNQVKTLATLAAKNDAHAPTQPSVVEVTVEE